LPAAGVRPADKVPFDYQTRFSARRIPGQRFRPCAPQ
jgi:hypothetical protein